MVLRTLSVARVKYTLVALAFVLLCLGYVFQGLNFLLFLLDTGTGTVCPSVLGTDCHGGVPFSW